MDYNGFQDLFKQCPDNWLGSPDGGKKASDFYAFGICEIPKDIVLFMRVSLST